MAGTSNYVNFPLIDSFEELRSSFVDTNLLSVMPIGITYYIRLLFWHYYINIRCYFCNQFTKERMD